MNDLDLIAGLDDTTAPDPAVLERSLEALMPAFAAPGGLSPAAGLGGRTGRARWARAAVAAAVAAAVVAVAVQTRPTGPDVPTSGGPAGMPTSEAAPPSLTTPAPPQILPTGPAESPPSEAALVLRRAAAVVLAAPPVEPRADQFLYVTSGTSYEAWLSIDGTHSGEVRNPQVIPVPGCVDGVAMVEGNAPAPRPMACTPDPAYLAEAPTTPQGMADYLISEASGRDPQGAPIPPSPNQQGKLVLSVLQHRYLLPAARAALFEALPLLPTLTMSTAELPGRNATTVSWSFSGAEHSLLFDSSTFEYLGFAYTAPGSSQADDPSVVTQRIVDAVGLRS